jgi:hypothetical protein
VITPEGTCEKFYDSNCLEFGSRGCKTCNSGFLKVDLKDSNLNVSQCRPNEEVFSYNKVEHCLTHAQHGRCLKCEPGFALNFNNFSCHKLDNCSVFDSRKRMCISCASGYYIHESGSCEKGGIDKCRVYSKKNTCIDCEDDYFLKSFFDSNGALMYRRCIIKQTLGKFHISFI